MYEYILESEFITLYKTWELIYLELYFTVVKGVYFLPPHFIEPRKWYTKDLEKNILQGKKMLQQKVAV